MSEVVAQSESLTGDLGQYYYRIGISRETRGNVKVLLGRVTSRGIEILGPDKISRFIPIGPGMTKAKRRKYSRYRFSKAWKKPTVRFEMNESDLLRCSSHKELRTFLQTVPFLKGFVSKFDITVVKKEYEPCARWIQKGLKQKGVSSRIAVGNLPKGGLAVRAHIVGVRQPMPTEPGVVARILGDEKASHKVMLLLGKGAEVPLSVGEDGVFCRSFDIEEDISKAPLTVLYKGTYGWTDFKVSALPTVRLGDNRGRFDSTRLMQVYIARWDRAAKLEIPKSYFAEAVEIQRKARDIYRWSLGNAIRYLHFEGTGIAEPGAGIVPFDIRARYRVSRKFYANAEMVAPLMIAENLPSIWLSQGDINYWVLGNEKVPTLSDTYESDRKYRASLGLGGMYYQARGSEEIAGNTGLLVSDVLGVYAIARGDFEWNEKTRLFASYLFAPFPHTEVTEYTVSWSLGLGAEYCWKQNQCAFGGYRYENFEVEFIDLAHLKANLSSTFLGYRLSFK